MQRDPTDRDFFVYLHNDPAYDLDETQPCTSRKRMSELHSDSYWPTQPNCEDEPEKRAYCEYYAKIDGWPITIQLNRHLPRPHEPYCSTVLQWIDTLSVRRDVKPWSR